MRTVLVANTKGGCGKTTIATNLAAAFAVRGLRTALADADRQRSSLEWTQRRPRDAAPILPLDWAKSDPEPPAGIERLVIDAPAALKMKDVEALVRLADAIVLPVLPSSFDEAATARFLGRLDELKPIRKSRAALLIVGNRVRPRTRAATRLAAFLAEHGQRTVATLRDSSAIVDAATAGLGLFDLRGVRSREVRADWAPLIDAIEAAFA